VDRNAITTEIAKRLVNLHRYESAAAVLKEQKLTGKAIQALMAGQLWDKALQMAKGTEFEGLAKQEYVENMKRQSNVYSLR
jgi:hypothetical protein